MIMHFGVRCTWLPGNGRSAALILKGPHQHYHGQFGDLVPTYVYDIGGRTIMVTNARQSQVEIY